MLVEAFVRNDLLNDKLEVLSVEQAYAPSNLRESRDTSGRLSFVMGDDRLSLIRGLPVVNVVTGGQERL